MQGKQLAYIAGFLDGDGCLMVQYVRRKDYVLGFQIRTSIVFYQKTKNKRILLWLQNQLKAGYVRDRNDDMTEYTIVGYEPVKKVLKLLYPYLILKKESAKLTIEIINFLLKERNLRKAVERIGYKIDRISDLNYSKRKTNDSKVVLEYLQKI